MIPYLSRLEPRLTDAAASCRALSLMLFEALAAIRPAPPELIEAGLSALKSSQSTRPTAGESSPGPSLGAQMLWVLLPAGAEFHVDPATHITEGRDSEEVQAAVIEFLRRSDQTTESLSESIRALALAQPQNPAVNADLLRLLDSPDVEVQKALLQNLPKLTLPPKEFERARSRVKAMSADSNTPEDLRRMASELLPCWSNDRHHGVCPAL